MVVASHLASRRWDFWFRVFFTFLSPPMFRCFTKNHSDQKMTTLELRSLLASVASELTLLSPLGVILLRRRCVCHAFGRAHRQRITRASWVEATAFLTSGKRPSRLLSNATLFVSSLRGSLQPRKPGLCYPGQNPHGQCRSSLDCPILTNPCFAKDSRQLFKPRQKCFE